ncbi:hypothetical protein, partial [Corynebacterium glyciniphilum]|uniref:hypothetical protein n=1 Tax=Corynebacterium glyciniphilum TaxID=1404244 RepID=UPI003F7AE55F
CHHGVVGVVGGEVTGVGGGDVVGEGRVEMVIGTEGLVGRGMEWKKVGVIVVDSGVGSVLDGGLMRGSRGMVFILSMVIVV